jgi:hypothetical protein
VRWGASSHSTMGAFYRREREHGVMAQTAGARRVPAKEGEGRSVLSATGGEELQRCSGAFVGGGLVWCRGEQVSAAMAASMSLHSGRGQSGQEGQRRMERCGVGQAGPGRFPPRAASPAISYESLTCKISH